MDITGRLKRDLEAAAESEYTTFAPGQVQGLCADALNEIERLERRLEEAGVQKPFAERYMKTTHTHRGTCQACGKVQAVDNTSKLIAKHGYKVAYGAFQFVCNAADMKPAEFDTTYTHTTIVSCLESAVHHDSCVPPLKGGEVVPATFERWNGKKVVKTRTKWGMRESFGGYDTLPIEQATADERKSRIAGQIRYHELQAEGLRDHVQFLRTHVLIRLSQPLYVAAELNAPKPVAPPVVVDVKNAKVVGTFKTKQARKDALDTLNRAYNKAHKRLQDIYLTLPHDQRTEAKTAVYYGPHDLCNWRPKHAEAALREFPQAAELVQAINALVTARAAVKAAP